VNTENVRGAALFARAPVVGLCFFVSVNTGKGQCVNTGRGRSVNGSP